MNWPLIFALLQSAVYAFLFVRYFHQAKAWKRRAEMWQGFAREWKREACRNLVESHDRFIRRRK